MGRHSLAYFFSKLLLSSITLILIGFLYWSFVLQEESLQRIEREIRSLKESLHDYKAVVPVEEERAAKKERVHIDPALPNLLEEEEDSYFSVVLPQLLGENFTPKGIFRAGTLLSKDNLHPFTNEYPLTEWIQGYCSLPLAKKKLGFFDRYVNGAAIKIEERKTDSPDLTAFWVHLREGLFWHPLEKEGFSQHITLSDHFLKKHPVTAEDFAFHFQAFKNVHVDKSGAVSSRTLQRDMVDVKVIDPLTFVVYYKKTAFETSSGEVEYKLPYHARIQVFEMRPLASFVYKYGPDGKKLIEQDGEENFYRKSSVWAQQFTHHFAQNYIPSCGPFIFEKKTKEKISFRRNWNYFRPLEVLYEGKEVLFVDSVEALWRDFQAQKIDTCTLYPKQLIELETFLQSPFYLEQKKKGREIQKFEFLHKGYGYVGWNMKNPLFKEKKVRQALTLAVDIKRLIRQSVNGQGIEITGSFFPKWSSYDHSIKPWPYDPDEARRILHKEGWSDRDGDGIIEKEIDGVRIPFRFKLVYYNRNVNAKANAELLSLLYKEIGVDCIPHGVDSPELSNFLEDKSFDAVLMGWVAQYPEDPRQLWHSAFAAVKGSSNYVGFENKEADELIEALYFEHDASKRKELSSRFHALIHEECPYLFLYNLKNTVAYWNTLKHVFIPEERQDLIPGANEHEPSLITGYKEI